MPAGEIAAAITSVQATLNIVRAMSGMRDAEMMRSKTIDLQAAILESLNKAIEAREASTAQGERIRALENEIAELKAWDENKQRYELKQMGEGAVAYMLKVEARGDSSPYWLCPTCFANRKTSFFQPVNNAGMYSFYECSSCRGKMRCSIGETPEWR